MGARDAETGARPLRGRRAELASIRAALGSASENRPAVVAMIGEPGIGKSRLAMEAATIAAEAGFAIRWGRAWEAGGAPAYWPWRQLCERLDGDRAIAQLWGARHGGAEDPDQARFELFDAVTRALANAAAAQPLLCIFDDLHAADVASLELVGFATRHLRASRLAWLLSWRDVEGARSPVREHLVRISREAAIVSLGGLTDVEANELIDDVRGEADAELRERLVRTTAGNPLFLLETLRALAAGHGLPRDDAQLPLGEAIAVIVNERLAPLPAATHALAAAASVVGRDVAVARWVAAAGCDAESVRRGAGALVAAGILSTAGHDRWRFGHDLVREAIYRATGDAAAEMHRRIAHVLDGEIEAGDLALVGERAHHGLCANVDTRTALDWTIAAADHARGQCAYEEAVTMIERAIARLGSVAERDGALQLARGRALLDIGDPTARDAFATAIRLARRAGDYHMVAAAALAFGARYVLGDQPHELIAMLDEAMLLVPETEQVLHGRLLARKAAALTPAPEPGPVLEMAREGYQLASSSTDDAVRLEVAVAVGAAYADFIHPRARVPINETVVAMARAKGDRALELRGLSRLVTDFAQAGDFSTAETILATRNELARSLVQRRFVWLEPLFRSMSAMVRGDFAVCDAAVAEAEAYADVDPNVARACAVHRAWLYLYSDRVDRLRAHEAVVLGAIRSMKPIIGGLTRAAIRLRSGELAEARREIDALVPGLDHGAGVTNLATIAEVAVEVGPQLVLGDLYERLAPFADTYQGWGVFAPVCGPPVAATLGDLAGALGDTERARAHFESALALTTASGHRMGRAWTGYWYGRTLARFDDHEAARVLDDAARDAAQLGMTRLVERCRAAATRAHAPAPRAAVVAALRWSISEHAGSWRVVVAERNFLVPNLRGMAMLARLAASPDVDVHSLELVSGGAEVDGGDAGELLDDAARAAYRTRIAALAETIEDAEARGDFHRAEAAQEEREALVKELARAFSLRGKTRRAGVAAERARVTAQRRLRDAIRKIDELDAELGQHLAVSIRTGMFCAYRPQRG